MLWMFDNLYRYIRREIYKAFRTGYISQSVARRKGKCLRCGCCTLIRQCRYFKPPNTCLIYGTDKMPANCKNYPFDENDKVPFSRGRCGFYWEGDK